MKTLGFLHLLTFPIFFAVLLGQKFVGIRSKTAKTWAWKQFGLRLQQEDLQDLWRPVDPSLEIYWKRLQRTQVPSSEEGTHISETTWHVRTTGCRISSNSVILRCSTSIWPDLFLLDNKVQPETFIPV